VCVVGSGAIFALYPDDERPGKTAGTRHDMEKGVHGPGLGVFSYSVDYQWLFVKIKRMFTNIFIGKYENV
jgi:hypothetical protein